MTYGEAINDSLRQNMERDDRIIVYGQGVNDEKRILGTTKDLVELFGPERVFDTPLSEDAMTGVGIGMALYGLRPIYIHTRMDFLLLTFNQIINMAAKMKAMYGGIVSSPIVIRVIIGKSWGQGPQHSQSFYSMLANIPGLLIVAPTTPYDAKGLMNFAIHHDEPVIFIEHRSLYYQEGDVPKEYYFVDPSKSRILKKGNDITIAGISQMTIEALRVAKILETNNISAEVIDIISPSNYNTVVESVKKTKRFIFIENGWLNCGLGAELCTKIIEHGIHDFSFKRFGFLQTACPTTPTLEKQFYPNHHEIAKEIFKMIKNTKNGFIDMDVKIEEVGFKGPF